MKKVLIVDDTKNIRNLLTTCLELEGFSVVTAIDSKQALGFLQNQTFDLVFLDIKLPEISGTEVLRRIRESGITTPVIIMTAFGTVKNAVECTKLGAVAYLQKPFTAEKVRNVLVEILSSLSYNSKDQSDCLGEAEKLIAAAKWEEAFQLLKQALAINPDCGATYYLLAKVYEAQGNHQEAERFYKIAGQFNL